MITGVIIFPLQEPINILVHVLCDLPWYKAGFILDVSCSILSICVYLSVLQLNVHAHWLLLQSLNLATYTTQVSLETIQHLLHSLNNPSKSWSKWHKNKFSEWQNTFGKLYPRPYKNTCHGTFENENNKFVTKQSQLVISLREYSPLKWCHMLLSVCVNWLCSHSLWYLWWN